MQSFRQHPDMIGSRVKGTTLKRPRHSTFSKIQRKDNVVYYAARDYVVVGIFEVTSDAEYLPDDLHWKEMIIYRIKPVKKPPEGSYLSLKKLIKDRNVHLDMFPRKKNWGGYLQGKTCKPMTQKDFLTIEKTLSKSEYLVRLGSVDRDRHLADSQSVMYLNSP